MTLALLQFDPALDLFPLLAASLAAVACAIPGNFLVLRRLSLMGDAISHSVLPGLVIAFLLSTTRDPLVMLLGATLAGVATVILVELVKRFGRVEPGAAMGVVFSALFALGVLLIEQAAARHVDLDADCVLHGQLETLVWYDAPSDPAALWSWSTLRALPRQVITLAVVALLAITLVSILFKELRIAAFDPQLATTQGYSATLLHYLLMVFVAAATVASFEAVGSILVIAMLICPAATARLLTDRLLTQILWSVALALTTSVGGYLAATSIPALFDKDAVNAAGSITVLAGLLFALAMVLSPRHGIIGRVLRRRRLADRVAVEDLLAALFRADEAGVQGLPASRLRSLLAGHRGDAAIAAAVRAGHVERHADAIRLTPTGQAIASDVVRRHRLWEGYLVDQAGLAPDHVHAPAQRLEHVDLAPPRGPQVDPHGQRIP